MCTALTYKTADHYFGRNLDLEYSYCETVTITPRNYSFVFRHTASIDHHYAMIGMATVVEDQPLYYEATNEHGLSAAGLNFPGNAVYQPKLPDKINITPFELIPWLLGQYRTVAEVRKALQDVSLLREHFSEGLSLTPLHWMVADRNESIVIEPMTNGLRVHDDPVGILTNNPPFEYHMLNLSNYLNLTPEEPTNRFSTKLDLRPYSRGLGSFGLPGDPSSPSRFIKAAFVKLNAVSDPSEKASVSQFFHILSAVGLQKGSVITEHGLEKTVYSSCCNMDRGIYYYTTYDNNQVTGIHLFHEDLEGQRLITYPLRSTQNILWEN